MNLNESDSGMTNISYSADIATTEPDKNVPLEQSTMDSTPISDIMTPQETAPMMLPQQQMMAPPQQPVYITAPPANPMNLTDEQMTALIVGLSSIVAFSGPVQDKLSTSVPKFMSDNGVRSSSGLVVTGLVTALIFYGVKRFIINK